MSLPAETKFPCLESPESDSMTVNWRSSDSILVECADSMDFLNTQLSRDQAESLRDQLTAWLNETKDVQ